MSQATTHTDNRDDQPTSPEELIEKHGRQLLEDLASDGNIAAQATLNIVDNDTEGGE